jgi:hypothetical protein
MRCALLLALTLAGAGSAEAGDPSVHVHLSLEGGRAGSDAERQRVRELEYELMARLASSAAGALVRDEWVGGACVLHLEGEDASALWVAVEPAVRAFHPRPGSHAILRHGARGAREERIELGERPTPRR